MKETKTVEKISTQRKCDCGECITCEFGSGYITDYSTKTTITDEFENIEKMFTKVTNYLSTLAESAVITVDEMPWCDSHCDHDWPCKDEPPCKPAIVKWMEDLSK